MLLIAAGRGQVTAGANDPPPDWRWYEGALECERCGGPTSATHKDSGNPTCESCASAATDAEAKTQPRCAECGAPCWALAASVADEHVRCADCWRLDETADKRCERCGVLATELVMVSGELAMDACRACSSHVTACLVEALANLPRGGSRRRVA